MKSLTLPSFLEKNEEVKKWLCLSGCSERKKPRLNLAGKRRVGEKSNKKLSTKAKGGEIKNGKKRKE